MRCYFCPSKITSTKVAVKHYNNHIVCLLLERTLTKDVEVIEDIFRIIRVLNINGMIPMTLKGPCVQGLVKWKVGQPAIDRLEQRGQGHVSFKWRKIGKLIPEKDLVNHVTSPAPLYEDMPNSLYTNQEEWWYWLYQVSSSKSGVTPALLKRMPQERSQEYDDELLVELTMNVMLQYPEMTPAGALKKAWKIVRGKTRAQLTRDPIVF